MTYRTRPDTPVDAPADLNRKSYFMSCGWYSLCRSNSLFWFILQHHYLVRMGHKMNASQLFDLFLPSFNSSLSCLQSLSVLSNFSRQILNPNSTIRIIYLQSHLPQHTIQPCLFFLSVSPVWNKSQSSHKISLVHVSCIPTITASAFFFAAAFFFAIPLQKQRSKDTVLFAYFLGFFKKK